MERSGLSRLLPIVLVLIVIGVIIAAVVSISRGIFSNRGTDTAQNSAMRDNLLKTDIDRSVRMTVRGPIVADERFRSYQVTISSTQRTMTTYQGYLEKQVATSQLPNSVRSYDEFVHALDHANFTKGTPLTGEQDDLRGICASGRVYEFELLSANNSVEHLWTSTCGGSPGSLKASVDQLSGLFLQQIPDSNKLASQNNL